MISIHPLKHMVSVNNSIGSNLLGTISNLWCKSISLLSNNFIAADPCSDLILRGVGKFFVKILEDWELLREQHHQK